MNLKDNTNEKIKIPISQTGALQVNTNSLCYLIETMTALFDQN